MNNEEYQKKNGLNVDVQSVVEEPHLYMMGFSRSTDEDQLMFIPTRRECLLGLSQTTEIDGVPITDSYFTFASKLGWQRLFLTWNRRGEFQH